MMENIWLRGLMITQLCYMIWRKAKKLILILIKIMVLVLLSLHIIINVFCVPQLGIHKTQE